jgi:hypothetical protein
MYMRYRIYIYIDIDIKNIAFHNFPRLSRLFQRFILIFIMILLLQLLLLLFIIIFEKEKIKIEAMGGTGGSPPNLL